jgi:hypothetical protein
MISQERKDQLKSEGEEGELQYNIRRYDLICQRRITFLLAPAITIFGMMLFYFSSGDPFFSPVMIFNLLLIYLIFSVSTLCRSKRSRTTRKR